METSTHRDARSSMMMTLAWLIVGVPLVWGVTQTIHQALALFGAGAQ